VWIQPPATLRSGASRMWKNQAARVIAGPYWMLSRMCCRSPIQTRRCRSGTEPTAASRRRVAAQLVENRLWQRRQPLLTALADDAQHRLARSMALTSSVVASLIRRPHEYMTARHVRCRASARIVGRYPPLADRWPNWCAARPRSWFPEGRCAR
jgi:hypothetical protein